MIKNLCSTITALKSSVVPSSVTPLITQLNVLDENVSVLEESALCGIEVPCFHCGLPVPNGLDLSVLFDGERRPMCCIGCQAVSSAIIGGGLEQFYQYRAASDSSEPSQASLYGGDLYGASEDDLSIYDLPEVQQELLRIDSQGLASIELTITGITCGACAWLIEHHLQRLVGIETVRVNVSRQRCRIQWQLETLPLSRLLAAFKDIGFRAQPAYEVTAVDRGNQEQRKFLQRLGVAGIGMMQTGMFAIALYAGAFQGMEARWESLFRWVSLLVATPVVLYSAQPFFLGAWRSLRALSISRGAYLTMDVPIALALALAYLASLWATVTATGEVYFDAVSMLTFFLLVGRFLEMRVRYRNDLVAGQASALIPVTVVKRQGNQSLRVPVKSLSVGDVIEVGEGECLAADGIVLKGHSRVVEAVLTGEQDAVEKGPGDVVSAGTINSVNRLTVEVSAVGRATRLAGILDMVDAAVAEKPRQVAIADNLAGWFVGAVLLLASLVFGIWWSLDPSRAIWVTLSVLVVTCPCALSLATPVVLAAATGQLQRRGFLIRRGHVLQTLARVSRVVLDKTGTLTSGQLAIQRIVPVQGFAPTNFAPTHKDETASSGKFFGSDKDSSTTEFLLNIAAALEQGCRHPVARAFHQQPLALHAEDLHYEVGSGVSGVVDDMPYALGKPGFAAEQLGFSLADVEFQRLWDGTKSASDPGLVQRDISKPRTAVMLANQQGPLAWIILADALRPGAKDIVGELAKRALVPELLSGDQVESVARLANEVGIEQWSGGQSPADKLAHVQALQGEGEVVLMVGDGINDVPVLAGSDVSIAIGDATSFTHIVADAVLLSGQLGTLGEAIDIAHKTERVIRQNIIWALLYNGCALPLAAMGWVPPWAAAIGMSVSSLVVVLNALRLQRVDGLQLASAGLDQSQAAVPA